MRDTDVVVFVVDASKGIRDKEREIAQNIDKLGRPCILVINKIDLEMCIRDRFRISIP